MYIHIPWCRIHCPYCAFAVVGGPGPEPELARRYTDALLRQWEGWRERLPGSPSTVYFGGGTPSRHPPGELRRLVEALRPVQDAEITAEANPEDVVPALLAAWADAGVNRVSVGVQTLQPQVARPLGRSGRSATVPRALELVASAGFRSWSADLIFAVPGQRPAHLEADLTALLAFTPPHVSPYELTAEPGTPYARAVERGRLQPPDADLGADLDVLVRQRLEGAGLHRYEVSNHARAGHESAHNQLYWSGAAYLGLGLGAHGWLPHPAAPAGERTVGHATLEAYLAAPWPGQSELPHRHQAAVDLLVGGLRAREGLDRALLAALDWAVDDAALAPLVSGGLLRSGRERLVLTPRGMDLADAITAKVVTALRDALV